MRFRPLCPGFPAEFCYQRFLRNRAETIFVIAQISLREIQNGTEIGETMQFAENGGDKLPNFVIFAGKSKLSPTLLVLKGTVSRDFLLQVFFHESPSPKPLKITLGSFQIFSKIR